MGIFNRQQDRYKTYNYRFNRPSLFGGFTLFPPVIKYLLISNVLIFLCESFLFRSFKVGNIPLTLWFDYYFSLNPLSSGAFYPWQLVTYMFMHANFMHLFFNMFALWMFGMELENLWGSKKFLFYYLMCGAAAGLCHLFISPMFGPSAPTVGASGSIYGVLVAFGLLFPDRPIFIYFLFPIKAKFFVLIYMVIELISVGNSDGIAHFAHLGGALAGFIYLFETNSKFTKLFHYNPRPKIKPKSPANIFRSKYYEKYNTDVSDADYTIDKDEDEVSQERIDEILDKISKEGYKNLTEEEKKILFDASKKIH